MPVRRCCVFAALCYAELAAMLPVSGSAYSYAYASMGEILAWTMGWLLLLEYGIAASTVAVGWSGYVVSFLANFGIVIPVEWTTPTITMDEATQTAIFGNGFNLPAFLGIMAMTSLLVIGVKESATVSNVIVFIAAFPTFKTAWKEPEKEDLVAWTMYFISCVLALFAIPAFTLGDIAQPLTFFVIESVMMILLWRPRRPKYNYSPT